MGSDPPSFCRSDVGGTDRCKSPLMEPGPARGLGLASVICRPPSGRRVHSFLVYCPSDLNHPLMARAGEVAEWSIAAVLKTAGPQGPGGSNPSLSASLSRLGDAASDGALRHRRLKRCRLHPHALCRRWPADAAETRGNSSSATSCARSGKRGSETRSSPRRRAPPRASG